MSTKVPSQHVMAIIRKLTVHSTLSDFWAYGIYCNFASLKRILHRFQNKLKIWIWKWVLI